MATVGNGAMINAVNTDTYNRVTRRLITLQPSNRTLRMADGSLVPSSGIWRGAFEWGPVQVDTTFKVFPSGASWQMLVGKPLLEQVQAVQDYSTDTIQLPTHTGPVHIKNYTPPWPFLPPVLPTSISSSSYNSDTLPLTTETNHIRTNLDNLDHTVTDQTSHLLPKHFTTHSLTNTDRSDEEVLHLQMGREGREREHGEEELKDMVEGCEQGDGEESSIYTRLTEKGPFYPPHIRKIQELVHYGPLPEDKLQRLKNTIAEFVDTFALSVREVKPVDFIKFRVDIPEDVVFPLKVNQCPLTQAQKEFYLPLLDKFEAAGILQPIRSDEVRAVHPTVLAQKAHGAPGLTMDEIRWIVEDQCREVGAEPNQDLLP